MSGKNERASHLKSSWNQKLFHIHFLGVLVGDIVTAQSSLRPHQNEALCERVGDYAYMFLKYNEMVRGYNSRRVIRVNLTEHLTALDAYAIYEIEVPRSIPGSRQHWKSFSLSFSEQRTS